MLPFGFRITKAKLQHYKAPPITYVFSDIDPSGDPGMEIECSMECSMECLMEALFSEDGLGRADGRNAIHGGGATDPRIALGKMRLIETMPMASPEPRQIKRSGIRLRACSENKKKSGCVEKHLAGTHA